VERIKNKLLWPHEVGEAVGCSAMTVKRYADRGLIKFFRDAKGRRRFTPDVVETLRRELGLNQAEQRGDINKYGTDY
jgi:DNA-binding transcriptional MerR regulator